MDWQKDPVLAAIDGRIIGMIGACVWWANLKMVVARLDAMEQRPTTAALADAEWREIGRRIDALEKLAPSRSAGATVSLAYDPDVFAIDAQGRLTQKSGPPQRPDQCVISSFSTMPMNVDMHRLGETR